MASTKPENSKVVVSTTLDTRYKGGLSGISQPGGNITRAETQAISGYKFQITGTRLVVTLPPENEKPPAKKVELLPPLKLRRDKKTAVAPLLEISTGEGVTIIRETDDKQNTPDWYVTTVSVRLSVKP